jgi:ABC-type polysaccharide/polyol phosphate transport system ATPase subunit
MRPTIELRGVTKRYVKYEDAPMLLSSYRLRTRSSRSQLTAVRDLDLCLEEGGSLGVLGRNGAGKSTLLQMLCGVTAPTAGRVSVRGRVAPLISVGVGFHPELTGRENVYVNGTVLGMSRREIDRRFDEILAFSEIEEFIDTPVKFYSSGMFVRLGFSVAVAADPDVLLVDEVLAVGDFTFQMKCFRRMEEIRAQGTTLVVVSHNISAIRALCDRGIVLVRGEKVFDGDVHGAVSDYYSSLGQQSEDGTAHEAGGGARVDGLTLLGEQGTPTSHLRAGDLATFRLSVTALSDIDQPVVGLSVVAENGALVYADSNHDSPFPPLAAGQTGTFDVVVAADLANGGFVAMSGLHARGTDGKISALTDSVATSFYVSGRPLVKGVSDLKAAFRSGQP